MSKSVDDEDVEYFRQKLFAALKCPKEFLCLTEDAGLAKESSNESVSRSKRVPSWLPFGRKRPVK